VSVGQKNVKMEMVSAIQNGNNVEVQLAELRMMRGEVASVTLSTMYNPSRPPPTMHELAAVACKPGSTWWRGGSCTAESPGCCEMTHRFAELTGLLRPW